MRTLLVVAALLALLSERSAAASSSCAVLFRDEAALTRAASTVQLLAPASRSLSPAFPDRLRSRKTASTAPALRRWRVLTFATTAERDAALAGLRAHADIVTAEAIRSIVLPADVVPLGQALPWNVEWVRAPQALAEVDADSSLIVAVIDTGADLQHPALQAQLWDSGDAPGNASTADDATDQNGDGVVEQWERDDDDDNGYVDDQHGYDFTDAPGQGGFGDATVRDPDPTDDQGHGTHVAGIIAARGAVTGVAPFVRLMPVRAAFSTGFGGGVLETDDAAAAIVYAVDNGARVLNLSWGDTVESQLIRAALDHAEASGVLVVAAAGNAASTPVQWPAADPRVVAVGSATRSGQRSAFSNHGAALDLLAPGEEAAFPGAGIVSTEPLDLVPDGIGERRGTSMAAPHVAGVAAIVLSRSDRPDAATARALLLQGARRTGSAWTSERGHGLLDALASVQAPATVIALWHGPSHAYRGGSLHADATVWGSALQRFQITAQHDATGEIVTLQEWQTRAVWREPVLDMPFVAPHQGSWQLVLRAESTQGVLFETRRQIVVDDTPPGIDSVSAHSAWLGATVQWLVGVSTDDPVAVQVLLDSVVVVAAEGYATRHLLQTQADAALQGTWTVSVRNAADGGASASLASPTPRPAWSGAGILRQTDTASFRPQAVRGETPMGRTVVWGQGAQASTRDTVLAAQVSGDLLQVVTTLSARGRAAGYGDIDGDGRADLLLQNGQGAEWWTTCATCEFPDQRLASRPAERVLGLFDLDDDAALETILSSRDSLYLFDDATSGPPALLQVLANPQPEGFSFWGADAAVGDLDADGRIELVCGDGEGRVAVFEAVPGQAFALQQGIDTQGSYAYDVTAVPPDGFIVGRQRTQSVTGDGDATTAWDFLWYRSQGAEFVLEETWPFLSAVGDLRAASTFEPTPVPRMFLVRGDDLYVLERQVDAWQPLGWRSGADGDAPLVGELQAGGQHLVLPTSQGSTVFALETQSGPHDLAAESLGEGRLRLTWSPGEGTLFRVRRRLGTQAWEDLGTTPEVAWVDSTAPARVLHEYEVQWLVGATVAATSNRILAQSQSLPRLQGIERRGPSLLRCRFTQAMDPATLSPRAFRVQGVARDYTLQSVQTAGEGRFVDLLLDVELACDSVTVQVEDVRDVAAGLVDPTGRQATLRVDCASEPFVVRHILPESDGFLVAFSQVPSTQAAVPATYHVTWDGLSQVVSSVAVRSDTEVFVRMRDALVGRGIVYRVDIDPTLLSAAGTALQRPAEPFEVLWDGAGATAVFVAPNPVRPGTSEVVFAEAAADTRVVVYTLEGERVRTLGPARGGAVRWDLRSESGTPVSAGTYVYLASDSRGRSVGRLVVIR